MQMTTDHRDDFRRSNLKTIPDADWSRVEAAIRDLDGKSHTELMLAAEADGPYLMIGGGPSRNFVFIWTGDERNLILTDPHRHEGKESLIVGGQSAIYPSGRTVALDDVLVAAQTYFKMRAPDQSLVWIDD